MQSVSHFIEALGGPSRVADWLGIKAATTVASWSQRGSIPVPYWMKLIEMAAQKGVQDYTYKDLVTIHTPEPQRVAS